MGGRGFGRAHRTHLRTSLVFDQCSLPEVEEGAFWVCLSEDNLKETPGREDDGKAHTSRAPSTPAIRPGGIVTFTRGRKRGSVGTTGLAQHQGNGAELKPGLDPGCPRPAEHELLSERGGDTNLGGAHQGVGVAEERPPGSAANPATQGPERAAEPRTRRPFLAPEGTRLRRTSGTRSGRERKNLGGCSADPGGSVGFEAIVARGWDPGPREEGCAPERRRVLGRTAGRAAMNLERLRKRVRQYLDQVGDRLG